LRHFGRANATGGVSGAPVSPDWLRLRRAAIAERSGAAALEVQRFQKTRRVPSEPGVAAGNEVERVRADFRGQSERRFDQRAEGAPAAGVVDGALDDLSGLSGRDHRGSDVGK
jgi:hypothetical protein